MDKAYIIPDEHAMDLVRKGQSRCFDEQAMLAIWFFNKQPPAELVIDVDDSFEYALSRAGERLGLVERHPREGWILFSGDNRVVYTGVQTKVKNRYRVYAEELCLEEIEEKHRKVLDMLEAS